MYAGPRQSRFFAQLAVENMPSWLIEQTRLQSLTLADWGCAQGDGTNVLASFVDPGQLVGVDFSGVAIEQAARRYPTIRFKSENWLEEATEIPDSYDVVFSSNTLEHFHQPYEVLKALGARAKKAVVLALPYRELELIEEHFYSFLSKNIPIDLSNGFRLIWSKVIDCRHLPDTLWGGDQIFLVYAESSWLTSLNLTLGDCNFVQDDATAKIASLHEEIATRDSQIASLNMEVGTQGDQITRFHQEVKARDSQVASINHELIRLSDWAQRIDQKPLQHGFKKYGIKVLRSVYRTLPLPSSLKYQLRSATMGVIGSLRKIFSFPQQKSDQLLDAVQDLNRKWKNLEEGAQVERTDVLVFSVIDWHFRMQRPQHLARSFSSNGKRVFFLSNHFLDSNEYGYEIERLDPSLDIYQIKLRVKGAPAIYFGAPTTTAISQLEHGIAKLMSDFAIISSIAVVQHPYWYPVVCHIPNSIRLYDCMDHHEGFGGVPTALAEIEKDMLRGSDLVVVTSSWLENFASGYNKNVVTVRNAGEYSHFSVQPVQRYVDASGRRIIGYFGAIAEWFDIDLIRHAALVHPNALILLIGNDTIEASKSLKDLPNVLFIGEVPYAKLPFYLYAFDVCLLPFKITPLTLATNPVKVYEYLAAGKPVISVDLPEIAQFGDLVLRARTSDEFITMISQNLATTDSDELKRNRQLFAKDQTWEHRAEALIKATIDLPMPKISVVVLTFNNLELTKACLDSLVRFTCYPNIELILVDNASTDESPTYLTEFKNKHKNIKLILNEKNLGFSAGNNVGLKEATGDFLVMLNNDTVVTPGWLMTLMRHLQINPTIGIIGPVTNNIGNEAKININYSTPKKMLPLTFNYTLNQMGKYYPLQTAAFFCVMIPRNIFEEVGLLDENFGRGFFEDDDYCRRVEAIGKTIVCAHDVFIHHHLSASFNKLKGTEKQDLFDQNKRYYETKWGKWKPHTY